MKASTRRSIQIVLAVLLVAAAARLVFVYNQRQSPTPLQPARASEPGALDPDAYVVPRRVRAFDLNSLQREVKGKPAWAREGYRYTYYPLRGKGVDWAHEAGMLGPIERLDIQDVITAPTPGAPNQHDVLLVFSKGGRRFGVPVGVEQRGDYQIFFDEIFFIQDPRELYKHWPASVWDAVAKHEIREGMNEIQASFAAGMGVPQPGGGATDKKVHYPNGGHPLLVVYRKGKAVSVATTK
ncbi:MAG TPA: hypothetical protein VFA60_04515 [Terriglobales bacterium]|nr:hypothetical protein [Terriglobales bacterium]